MRRKGNFTFKTLPPARRLATSLDRGRRGLNRCLQRRATVLLPPVAGKITFLLKGGTPSGSLARHLPYANPQNSTALVSGNPVRKGGLGWCASAQTRRGALRAPAFPTKVSLVLERANGVRPYGFDEKADCLYRLCSPHPPRRARSPFPAGEGLG